MKKLITNSKDTLIRLGRWLWQVRFYLLVLLITLPAVKDLLLPGYFPMHDDLQILRLLEMDKCVKDLQLPCRLVPDPGFGYSYPMFNYYPPLPYYLAEAFYLLGVDIFWSIKIVFILSFVISGLAMFALAAEFFGVVPALVAAAFYIWAPYHSVDVFVRGAMNEAWGLAFFPLLLLYSYRLCRGDKNRFLVPTFSLSLAALLLSHNVMALIFSPLLGIWMLLWLYLFRNFKEIRRLFVAGIWGVSLAAFFFLPVVLEAKLVHVETMTIGYFNYLAHFADINQLFFTRFWGYGGSTWGPEDDMAFPVGHFHWIAAVLAILVVAVMILRFIKSKHSPKSLAKIVTPSFFLFFGSFYIFLTHSRAVWFWDHLPLLYYAQFPWRLLAIPALAYSFLAAFVMSIVVSRFRKLGAFLAILVITGVVIWNWPFFRIQKQVEVSREDKLSGLLWELQVTGGIFDYLPRSASRPPGSPAPSSPEFVEGKGGITDYQHTTNWWFFGYRTETESRIRVPVYDYPKMIVWLDGKKITHDHDKDLGRIEFVAPAGTHKVEVRFLNTPIRILANLVSLVSMLVLVKYLRSKEK